VRTASPRDASAEVHALKVCCIQDEAELRLAAAAGADFVGLVGAMPSGPGPIDDVRIARLAAVAEDVRAVLLTARTRAEDIAAHVRATGVRAVQLVRPVHVDVRRALREALPGVEVFQVVHVEGPGSVDQALQAADGSDYLLLDSGRPSAAVAELGGTGRVHDWALSARIVEAVDVPVFLAGGLRPDNVAEAVRAVRPHGVDVCSGLRDGEGRLVAEKLASFTAALRAAERGDA
jgi:phosphoribosylanthranilate isomerase